MEMTALIYKVLSGKASEDEKKELDNWLAKSTANRNEFEDLNLLWNYTKDKNEDPHPDGDFYDGLRKIRATMKLLKRKDKIINAGIASIMMVVVAVAGLYYYSYSGSHPPGNLKFDNAPLENIISSLEKEYNIDVKVENEKILPCRFTGTFYRTSTIDDIIKTLASALNLEYKALDTRIYLLKGNGCQTFP